MPIRLSAIMVILAALLVVPLNALGKPRERSQSANQGQEGAGTVWGGEHLEMEVTKQGATLEFDCATGTITEPLAGDAQGKFRVGGTFTRERPGPTMRDGSPALAATYSGSINGETMHLHMVAGANKEITEDYVLVRGQSGRVMKCR